MQVEMSKLPKQIQDEIQRRNTKQDYLNMMEKTQIQPLTTDKKTLQFSMDTVDAIIRLKKKKPTCFTKYKTIPYRYNAGVIQLEIKNDELMMELLKQRHEATMKLLIPLLKQFTQQKNDLITMDNKINKHILDWKKEQDER